MNDKINGKTPTEIKIALNCTRTDVFCNDCPYGDHACGENLDIDALAYIEQLERERDAAVEQLKEVDRLELFCCSHCKHEELDDFSCTTCIHMSNWEWIGVQNCG